MSSVKIDQDELPEHVSLLSFTHFATVAGAVGTTVLAAPGHHPKCRLTYVSVLSLAYNAVPDQYVVEDGDGVDASVAATQSATVNTPVDGVLIAGQVFERNEAIVLNRTVKGDAANACLVTVRAESID